MAGNRDVDGRHSPIVIPHCLALLEEIGHQFPGCVVVFEDLHWADASTRDLVAYLARNLRPLTSPWCSPTGRMTYIAATRCARY